MKDPTRILKVLRALIAVSATLMVAAVANGCVAGSAPGTESSVDDPSQLHVLAGGGTNCCSDGYYWCSRLKNGGGADEFDYFVPGCGSPDSVIAHNNCTAACAVTCTNSGWINHC